MARRTQRATTIAAAVLVLGTTTMTGTNAADTDRVGQVQTVARDALGGAAELPVAVGIGDIANPPQEESPWPPKGLAFTSVQWSMSPGDATPTFTPPNPATSHPTNWECTTSITGTYAHASCMPTSAPDPGFLGWNCYDPFVVVDVISGTGSTSGGDAVTGRAKCGTTAAICHAATGITVTADPPDSTPVIDIATAKFGIGTHAAYCQHAAFPQQPAPLECDADFYAARPSATWTVRCAPIDP